MERESVTHMEERLKKPEGSARLAKKGRWARDYRIQKGKYDESTLQSHLPPRGSDFFAH